MYRKKRFIQFLLFSVIAPIITLSVVVVVTAIFPALRWWQVTAVVLPLWGIALWWEVAMRKDTTFISARELELLASQKKFVALYEYSPIPYVTINTSGVILTANLAAVRLFDTTIDAIQGQNLFSALSFSDSTNESVLVSKLSVHVPIVDMEAQIVGQSQERWVLLSIYSYAGGTEVLVSLVDITHQKLVDIAKSEFVALATHQLRTPVAAMRWNVELLRKSIGASLSDRGNAYVTKIERNVLRMVDLINDFLSVSKLETGTFATDVASISLSEQLDAVCEEFTNTISEKQIRLVRAYNPPDAMLSTDTRLFHIITSNVISNAVKYATAQAEILVRYEHTPDTVTITVADTGIGIPETELEHLFTKFYRASNAQAHRAEGTGLGLYIVKQSVEKLGGTIAVTSVENEGTTITIQLPTTFTGTES